MSHKQTPADKQKGKWSRNDDAASFVGALRLERVSSEKNTTDGSTPFIEVDKELRRYFHYDVGHVS